MIYLCQWAIFERCFLQKIGYCANKVLLLRGLLVKREGTLFNYPRFR